MPADARARGPSRRVLMVVYSTYPFDPRVRREAESLTRAGHRVDVLCLREPGQLAHDNVRGVAVHRLPMSAVRGRYLRYAYQYATFFLLATAATVWGVVRRGYDVVHVHSLPDFQVFGALPAKALGARVVLDLHESMAELFAARFRLPVNAPVVRFAIALQKVSCLPADRVITVNEPIEALLVARGVPRDRLLVIMNSPDERSFAAPDLTAWARERGLAGAIVLVFVGGLNPERDLETFLRAVAALRRRGPAKALVHGYGTAGYRRRLQQLIAELRLESDASLGPYLPPENVLAYLRLSTVGVVTYERSPLTEIAVPNKVFEFVAAGKALVLPRLGALQQLFRDAAVYYEPGDAEDLARQVLALADDSRRRDALAAAAGAVYDRCRWSLMEERLLRAYDDLLA